MAKSTEAFTDKRGNLHHSATEAVLSDITYALGRVGDEGGLTAGVARLILEKRADIEKAFADHDRLVKPPDEASTPPIASVTPIRTANDGHDAK